MSWRNRNQTGVVVWLTLVFMLLVTTLVLRTGMPQRNPQQAAQLDTLVILARTQQALLAYALQPLGLTMCGSNCPRPGDLPCPDRNNDGVAESRCDGPGQRLGRLPWKTLGLGDVRDASGERLWYAVSDQYKNNPRLLPLNVDTPGSWSLTDMRSGQHWHAETGQGLVAVLIAPMQPLVRADGLVQRRTVNHLELAQHFLDRLQDLDNAAAIEFTSTGFVMGASAQQFNDIVWPVLATAIHQVMQQQVLSEVVRAIQCSVPPCANSLQSAAMTDSSCLSALSLVAGSCRPATGGIGRLPLDTQAHWPLASEHVLDGAARHHWFQQNGWREHVLWLPATGQVLLMLGGESLAGQARVSDADKAGLPAYLELSTLQTWLLSPIGGLNVPANDRSAVVTLP